MKPHRVELKDANEFVASLHRHHKPVTGHRFSIGAEHGGKLVGVAIVGRPVARAVDQKMVAEVTRMCTDGTKNACSFLYAACARIAKDMGFTKIQTYILEIEDGTTLRAAGWIEEAHVPGRSWSKGQRAGKRRTDQPETSKTRWAKQL